MTLTLRQALESICHTETSGGIDVQAYDEVYARDGFYWGTTPNGLCRLVVEEILPRLGERAEVIDLGCGEGRDLIHFARYGCRATGVDISAPGLEKARRWAEAEGLEVETILGDLATHHFERTYDVVYSSGAATYIAPWMRPAAFEQFKRHTRAGGFHALNAFVEKPFIATAPDFGDDEYFYRSGELLAIYWDWKIIRFEEVIFDCDSSGIPHQHAMDVLIAQKP